MKINNGKESDNMEKRCPRDVMVKAMDCRIVVREFKFQSRYSLSDKYHWRKI